MADFKAFTSEEALDDYFSSLLDGNKVKSAPYELLGEYS